MLIDIEAARFALPAGDRNRNQLFRKLLRSSRYRGSLLAFERELVLLIARDLVHRREIFSGLSHHQVRQRAEEAIAIHAVDEMMIPHAQSPSRLLYKVRDCAHGFRAAGDNNICVTEQNFLISEDDRF